MTSEQSQPLSDDLLSGVKAIAGYLGETPRRVHYLHETGQLPTFKVGSRIYVRKTDLERVFSCNPSK